MAKVMVNVQLLVLGTTVTLVMLTLPFGPTRPRSPAVNDEGLTPWLKVTWIVESESLTGRSPWS